MLVSLIIDGAVSRPSEPAHYAKDKGIKSLKRTVFFHYAKRISLSALLCFAVALRGFAIAIRVGNEYA